MSRPGGRKGAYPTLYQRLQAAAERGAGMMLTADEVEELARNPDLVRRAQLDDELQERAEAAIGEL